MTGDGTIAAISTAPGEGGIGIVRVSGAGAEDILSKIFSGGAGVRGGSDAGVNADAARPFADRKMYYGHIVEPSSGESVDEVLVVFMKGPRSYTGEDVCEIQCHGGSIPLRRILDIVCSLGAAPAQPGEFSKRAFLNGRLDLVQAGAVIDLIRSRTALGYHAACEQASGRLSERVRAVREQLLGALAEIAVRIDYPEAFEGVTAGDDGEGGEGGDGDVKGISPHMVRLARVGAGTPADVLEDAIAKALAGIETLLADAEAGRLVRDGLRAAIIGKPNTGKSSLFNALAREDAAIVTAAPGTTRDALEIWLDIKGVPVLLTDTAGIREDAGEIEKLGIERAWAQYDKADVSIFLLDGSLALSREDKEIAEMLDPEKKTILVINKADLPQAFGKEEAGALASSKCIDEENIINISLLDDKAYNDNENGLEILELLLQKAALGNSGAGSSLLVTKARHKNLLEKAGEELREATGVLLSGAPPEFAEVNIRAAWNALGDLTGETASDDVIDRVFEEFCVGK